MRVQPPLGNSLAQSGHQPLEEPQIMLGHQHRAEDLGRADEVMDIGAVPGRAGRARAAGLQWLAVLGEAGVADVDRPVGGECLAGAPRAGRQHAIEHVDPAPDRLDDVVGLADPHQVARPVGGQHVDREIEHAAHLRLPLAHRQPADRIAIEADLKQSLARSAAQRLEHRALLDPEQCRPCRMLAARVEGVARPFRPAHRPLHRRFGLLLGRRERRAFVERHDDVGVEQALDLDRALGAEHVHRPVEVALEADPLLALLGQLGEAHHLIAAAVGQDRPLPAHEAMQPAQPRDPLRARAEHQMIGVAEDDVGARRAHARPASSP